MAPARCSRPGCQAREAEAGEFWVSSPCNAQFYCSPECELEDRCSDDAPCTVQALQEAAETGPFTARQFEQVARLLNGVHVHASPNLAMLGLQAAEGLVSVPPNVGIALAALAALRTALTHPPADPLSPPPGFLASGLLPALANTVPHLHTPSVRRNLSTFQMLLIDAIAAALNALLSHPLHHAMTAHSPDSHSSPAALAAWAPIVKHITEHSAYSYCIQWSFTSQPQRTVTSIAQDERYFWDLAGLPGAPPASRPECGLAGMLSLGYLRGMALQLGLMPPVVAASSLESSSNRAAGGDKVAMLVEQEVVPLPHPAVALLLQSAIQASDLVVKALLERPDAMRALARPLEALAADPLLCRQGAYANHAETLASGLFDFVAGTQAVQGLQRLSQYFTRPLIAALDTLLDLGRDDRSGAKLAVLGCLVLMTSMAYTPHGQSCMAASGCVPRWLELAPRWKGEPLVLEQLLLLLQVPYQTRETGPYFRKLCSKDGQLAWVKMEAAGQRPPLMDQQMSSSVAMDAITQLIQSVEDANCLALLANLALNIGGSASAVRISQAAAEALLAFCQLPVRQPPSKETLGSSIVDQYIAETDSAAHMPQPWLLAMLARLYTQMPERVSGAPSGGAGGRPVQVPQALLEGMARWLELFATEDGLLVDPVSRNYGREMVLTAWRGLVHRGCVALAFLRQHRVLQLWFRMLQHLQGNDDALLCAVLAMQATNRHVPRDEAEIAQVMNVITDELINGPGIEPVLACLERHVVAARGRGAGLQTLFEEEVPMEMFKMVAYCYGQAAVQSPAAGRRLLTAKAFWEVYKTVVDEQDVTDITYDLLGLRDGMVVMWCTLQACLGRRGEVGQLAEAVVKLLGRRTVERVLQAPWLVRKQVVKAALRPAAFLRVFEQGGREGGSGGVAGDVGARGRTSGSSSSVVDSGGRAVGGVVSGGRASSGVGSAGEQQPPPSTTRSSNAAAAVTAAAHAADEGTTGCRQDGPGSAAAAGRCAAEASGSTCTASTSAGTSMGTGVRECSVCHAQPDSTFLCSVCQSVRYCSRECQKADWKRHKKACKERQVAA